MYRDAPTFILGRSTGPIGRWVRLIAGILLIAFGVWDWKLLTAPRSFAFYGVVAFTLVALLGLYLAAHLLLGQRLFARVNPWVSTVILIAPPLIVLGTRSPELDAVRLGVIFYIAVSLIALFFIRYGGCEVVALPTLILRRQHTVYCPWNVIDAVDRAASSHEPSGPRSGPSPSGTR